MSDAAEVADRQLLQAVGEAMGAHGHARDDLIQVDVLVVVTQRGFEGNDGISRTVVLQPTDTPSFTILGMLEVAQIEAREYVLQSIRAAGEDDE